MTTAAPIDLQRAVRDAVALVNENSGRACVYLRFADDEAREVDVVANSAAFQGDRFVFTAGFETVDGSLAELAGIRTELIRH